MTKKKRAETAAGTGPDKEPAAAAPALAADPELAVARDEFIDVLGHAPGAVGAPPDKEPALPPPGIELTAPAHGHDLVIKDNVLVERPEGLDSGIALHEFRSLADPAPTPAAVAQVAVELAEALRRTPEPVIDQVLELVDAFVLRYTSGRQPTLNDARALRSAIAALG